MGSYFLKFLRFPGINQNCCYINIWWCLRWLLKFSIIYCGLSKNALINNFETFIGQGTLTLSWLWSLSHRNQPTDLVCKSGFYVIWTSVMTELKNGVENEYILIFENTKSKFRSPIEENLIALVFIPPYWSVVWVMKVEVRWRYGEN